MHILRNAKTEGREPMDEHRDQEVVEYDSGFQARLNGEQSSEMQSRAWQNGWYEADQSLSSEEKGED